jgi:hypothetical protein
MAKTGAEQLRIESAGIATRPVIWMAALGGPAMDTGGAYHL